MNASPKNCNRRLLEFVKFNVGCVLLCLGLGACATDSVAARSSFRVYPLKHHAPVAFSPGSEKTVLLFDDGALTQDEHKNLLQEMQQRFGPADSKTRKNLRLQLESCRVIVHVGRSKTQYNAICNAQLKYDGVPLTLASARAERETRTRAVSARALAKAKNRNPWMELKHIRHVLMSASASAVQEIQTPLVDGQTGYAFTKSTVAKALKNDDTTVLRAIAAKLSNRQDLEDDDLLLQLTGHPNHQLAEEAARSLFLRCAPRTKKHLERISKRKDRVGDWATKGLACIQAVELGLMPPRETTQAPVHGS